MSQWLIVATTEVPVDGRVSPSSVIGAYGAPGWDHTLTTRGSLVSTRREEIR